MTLKLRPYQIEARDAVIAEWQGGRPATLLAMATGTGKTETFLSVLDAERAAGRLTRAVILAHRRELIHQPAQRIADHWPSLPPVGIVMAEENQVQAPLVVATVQTLASQARRASLLSAGAPSHLIIDEAHHATARSYQSLIAALRWANPQLRILGTTATPKRSDKDGLVQIFDSVAYRISIKDAIAKWKALAPFSAIGVQLPVSFADVKQTADGWNEEEAGEVLSAANAEELIISTWQEQASARQTMAFTASVRQAHSLARAFVAAGIPSEAADGETPNDQREAIIARYRSGETRVLINCMLWTEGMDIPQTSCVLMVRPTRSDLVYVQCVGRGLRLAPGKADCLILDFAPQDARDLRMAGDLLGKPRDLKKAEEKALKKGIMLSFFMDDQGDGIDADPDEIQMKVLDYFGASRLAWTFDGGLATCGFDDSSTLAIVLPNPVRVARAEELRARGLWKEAYEQLLARISRYQVYVVSRHAQLVTIEETWEAAAFAAQQYADTHGDDILAQRDKKWRKQAASLKQQELCRKLGVWRPGMTRGEAAQAITHKLAMRILIAEKVLSHANGNLPPTA